ncbi:MAG: histone deacetylase [Caldilineaceae bacterium]|nr:histone deacetylase [Caldilineaceae bacterium]
MKKTAYVYDPFNLKHTLDGHPENFRRLQGTWDLLRQDGILADMLAIPSTPATLDAVYRVHTPQYVERLQSAAMLGNGRLDADTYINQDSYHAALLATGGLLNVVDAVMTGRADNGFALVRPPGHHALSYQGMGFCLFANAAVAARWAQDRHGVQRVLIVDFDVHHGNGTQDIFYDDPSVLFFSAHQFPYYPGSGAADEAGSEFAYGSTINVPFPAYVGDEGYLMAFRQILMPLAREFSPDLILLSAGFDAHWMDPLASMRLTIPGYAALVKVVLELADELSRGRIVGVLEGGYNLEVLAHAVLTTLRTFADVEAMPSDPFGRPTIGAERDVTNLLQRLKKLHNIPDAPFYSL